MHWGHSTGVLLVWEPISIEIARKRYCSLQSFGMMTIGQTLRDYGTVFAEQCNSMPRPITTGTIHFITYHMLNLPGRVFDAAL